MYFALTYVALPLNRMRDAHDWQTLRQTFVHVYLRCDAIPYKRRGAMKRQIEMVHAGSLTSELCDGVVCSFIRSFAIVLCESTKAKFSWRWIPQYSSIFDSIWCFFFLSSPSLFAFRSPWLCEFRPTHDESRLLAKYINCFVYLLNIVWPASTLVRLNTRECVCECVSVDRPACSLCWKSRSQIYIPGEWHRRKATAFYWNKSEGNVGEMNARIIKQE